MNIFFVAFAALAGVTSALQSGSNNTLQKGLGAPLWTIAIVSGTTLALSLIAAVVGRDRFPDVSAISSVPWWGWIGGAFGTFFVFATVYASPKLGAGLFIALIVTCSTVTSLVLDHFGLMSFDVHAADVGRIAGALLMIAGVALIASF